MSGARVRAWRSKRWQPSSRGSDVPGLHVPLRRRPGGAMRAACGVELRGPWRGMVFDPDAEWACRLCAQQYQLGRFLAEESVPGLVGERAEDAGLGVARG